MTVTALLSSHPGATGGGDSNRIYAYNGFSSTLFGSVTDGAHSKGVAASSEELFTKTGETGQLISCDGVKDRILFYDGFTSTLLNSYAIPTLGTGKDPYDADVFGGNLYHSQSNDPSTTQKLYQHSGLTSTITNSLIINTSAGYTLPGVGWRYNASPSATMLTTLSDDTNKQAFHREHSGFTSTINDSHRHNWSTTPSGRQNAAIDWDGANEIWQERAESTGNARWAARRSSGFSSTVSDSFIYPLSSTTFQNRRGLEWLSGGLVELISAANNSDLGRGFLAFAVPLTLVDALLGSAGGIGALAFNVPLSVAILTSNAAGSAAALAFAIALVVKQLACINGTPAAGARLVATPAGQSRLGAKTAGGPRISASVRVCREETSMACAIELRFNSDNDLSLEDVIDERTGTPVTDAATVSVAIFDEDTDTELGISPIGLSQLGPPDDDSFRSSIFADAVGGFSENQRLRLEFSYDAGAGKRAFFTRQALVVAE